MKHFQTSNKSLLRAVEVLRSFSFEEHELGPADIARKIGIPVSTVHRVLATLTQSGLLEQDKKTNKYTIGPDMYLLGNIYLQKTDLYRAAEPVVNLLSDLTKEAITIAIFNKDNVVYVMFKESPLILRTGLHIGSILPAHCSAIGRVFLDELSDEEIDELYPAEELRKQTAYSLSNKTELKIGLQKIRENGISFDSQGTFEGIDGIATAIRGADGKITAALGMPLPTVRIDQARCKQFSNLIKIGANLICHRLGYVDGDNPALSIEEIRSL